MTNLVPAETTTLIGEKEDGNAPSAEEEDDEQRQQHLQRLRGYQWVAFFLTFGTYFMAHFSRKCYSTVKQQLEEEAGYSPAILSAMDTTFMGAYAVGNIVSGRLGDMMDPTSVLSVGLFGSGACLFLICASLWSDLFGLSAFLASLFVFVVYVAFGCFQSTGVPVGTAVMGNWFSDRRSVENRGIIFGLWTCHQYCGDITAALCTAWVLGLGLAYWWALLIPSVANALWGVLLLRLLVDPADIGIVTDEVLVRRKKLAAAKRAASGGVGVLEDDEGIAAAPPITYVGALRIPMVARYAVAYGFLKLTNYVLFFWLPYFLGRNFDPVQANLIAAVYSVGMMPGGMIVGYLSDVLGGRRTTVIGAFLCTLIVFLAVFAALSEVLAPPALLPMLAAMGILVGGPNNIITTAVAVDLASHPSVRGNNKSLGTVTGLINGIGAIIASAGLLAVGPLQELLGWASVWAVLLACTAISTILLCPKIYSELWSVPPTDR